MKTKHSIKTITLTLAALVGTSPALAHHYKIDGIYKMHVQISDRLFVDLVTLKEESNHQLSGTVTVPGNFTAPLKGHYGGDSESFSINSSNQIEFTIEAIERGNKIRVLYQGEIDPRSGNDGIFFKGVAYDLDDPALPFGTIDAGPLKVVPIKNHF